MINDHLWLFSKMPLLKYKLLENGDNSPCQGCRRWWCWTCSCTRWLASCAPSSCATCSFFINIVKTSVRPKSYFFFIKTFENYTLGFSSPHSLQLNHSPANLASSSASVRRAVTELEPLEVLRVPSHVRKETIFVRSFWITNIAVAASETHNDALGSQNSMDRDLTKTNPN